MSKTQDPDTIYLLSSCPSESISPTKSEMLANEYGRDDDNTALANIFKETFRNSKVECLTISLDTKKIVLDDLRRRYEIGERFVVLQLCDGTEVDGYPGISVVRALEENCIAFTGAGSSFYADTTSKPILKKMLEQNNVATSKFKEIRAGHEIEDLDSIIDVLGFPLIVKPAISYASISISQKSIVDDRVSALEQIQNVVATDCGGVFLEMFLAGREFTVLCTGSAAYGVKVYTPVERTFNKKLSPRERILGFDQYWDGYGLNGESPIQKDALYHYELAPVSWQAELTELAKQAYLACGGTGYGRVDIRTKNCEYCEPYVLEVNANCGLSIGSDSSSLGEILRLSSVNSNDFCRELINFAMHRQTNNK